MENLKDAYDLADVIADEYSEILWDMIKSVQDSDDKENGTCDSLLKLANRLEEVREWKD